MPSIKATARFTPRAGSGQFVKVRITPAAVASVQAGCQMIFDRSQELVPVDTGELKASGKVVITEGEATVSGKVIYDANHAAYVEFGTGIRGESSAGAGQGPYDPNWMGMPAQPFLRPAYEEAKEPIRELFRSNISTAVSK